MNARLVSLFHHVSDTVSLCAQGREDMEVGFVACHVLQAVCVATQRHQHGHSTISLHP